MAQRGGWSWLVTHITFACSALLRASNDGEEGKEGHGGAFCRIAIWRKPLALGVRSQDPPSLMLPCLDTLIAGIPHGVDFLLHNVSRSRRAGVRGHGLALDIVAWFAGCDDSAGSGPATKGKGSETSIKGPCRATLISG